MTTTLSTPTASQKVFDADLLRFQRQFEAMPAAIVYEDGEPIGLDPEVVPDQIGAAYKALLCYGYANGLLP